MKMPFATSGLRQVRRSPPLFRWTAIAWALSMLPYAAQARTEARWTLTDIGPQTRVAGLNDLGQVVGTLSQNSVPAERGFVWQAGGFTMMLYGVGGFSQGLAINNQGVVGGLLAYGMPGRSYFGHAGFTSTGNLNNLSLLPVPAGGTTDDLLMPMAVGANGHVVGVYSGSTGARQGFIAMGSRSVVLEAGPAWGVNAGGTVVGSDELTGRGYLWRQGALSWLTPPAGSPFVNATALNDQNDVVGTASGPFGAYGVRWAADGSLHTLPVLPGSGGDSVLRLTAINNDGLVVGWAAELNSTGGQSPSRAALFTASNAVELGALPGVSGQGWVLRTADGVNALGQIAGNGVAADGSQRGYLLSLQVNTWQSAGGGAWDDAAHWAWQIRPNALADVSIEPVLGGSVVGPVGAVTVGSLTVGQAGASVPITTLALAGGRINVDASGGGAGWVQVQAGGQLGGRGEIAATSFSALYNNGRIVVDDLSLRNLWLVNSGVIEGHGRLLADQGVHNQGGQVRANRGYQLRIEGALSNNFGGRVEVLGGELEATQGVYNEAHLLVSDGLLRGPLYNQSGGCVEVGTGHSVFIGPVLNWDDGQVIVSGGGALTVEGSFENRGELRVSANASATFFGDFVARSSGSFGGTGQKYFEAGFAVGNSPGVAHDPGSLSFGERAQLVFELGGLAPGDADGFHDQLVAGGVLHLGGALQIVSWNGFEAQAGQRFDLFDAGRIEGRFLSVDTSGLRLAAGTRIDLSRLTLDGSVAVVAVPEPATWALWLVAGVATLGATRRSRHQARG